MAKAVLVRLCLKTGGSAMVDQLSGKRSTHMKRIKVGGLCLLSLCLATVFGIGAAGASAAPLLFIPHSGKYPYHAAGTGGKSLLETVGGSKVEAASTDILSLVLNATLFNLKLEFLKVKESLGSACHNDGKAEAILVSLLGHFGFADPGNVPAVLLEVPTGFAFECLGGFAKVNVRGEVIGEIASPALNTASELLRVSFKQVKGVQAFTTFLLGSTTLTNQFEESNLEGIASKNFEQSGQEGEGDLKALAGQGTFLLVSP
jgi:hypothetical protein